MTKQDYYIEKSILNNLLKSEFITQSEYEKCIEELKKIYREKQIYI